MAAPTNNDETIAQNLQSDNSNNEHEAKGIIGVLKAIAIPLFILGKQLEIHQNNKSELREKINKSGNENFLKK